MEINYRNFIKIKLGANTISTWLDDKNKNHATIMKAIIEIKNNIEAVESIEHPKFGGYMGYELFNIAGKDIVFMAGQPDGLRFKKDDTKALLSFALLMNSIDEVLKAYDNGNPTPEKHTNILVKEGILIKDENDETGYRLNTDSKQTQLVDYFEEGIA